MSQHDDEDEDRKAILARKAMFIASAMSGIALLDGCTRPQPCLSVVPIERPAPDASAPEASAPDALVVMVPEAGLPEPAACLSVLPLDLDAGPVYTPEAGLTQPMPCLSRPPPPRDAGRPPRPPEPVPQPCLTPVVVPQPCLSIAVPRVMPNKPGEDE
ncbi:MAG: hypothetical protein U0324_33145 [Polyangiales bacterium]